MPSGKYLLSDMMFLSIQKMNLDFLTKERLLSFSHTADGRQGLQSKMDEGYVSY